MNLPADIRAWLASERDFRAGAALYAQVGTSAVYQRLFGLGPSEYNHRVLVRELSALVGPEPAAPAVVAKAPAPPPSPSLVGEGRPTPPAPDSPHLVHVQLLQALRDERSHLHPQLTAKGTTQKRRYELAARIVALTDEEVKLKGVAAHVRQHGRPPGPLPLADVTDAGELRQRLHNLRSRRSKLKKDPARAAELAQVQADIDLIIPKLKS